MWFPVVVWMAVTAVSTEPLYMKIGDTAVLTPNSVVNPITSIVWKLGPNIAMVWNGGKIVSYQQFKDRGTLNISTGVMIITGLTRNHSGTYTAEINFKIIDKTELLVISAVPQPNLYVLCDPEMTYCVFTCDGSTTDAEPVEYEWTAGDERWTSTNQHRITKEEKEWWFSCTLENPVGSSSSEKVHNPFMKSDWRVMFILTEVILVVCIIIFCFRHKCRKERIQTNLNTNTKRNIRRVLVELEW
ncbi:uncharacterized protein LOC128354439 isoform X2 [Scomber scombrus]|uniref:Uncharacterized protein LOC128354439 isoform X2 n=1 Tax=Scomber scombrus TaxID=13677 RepID=A0AAV1Q1H4_SCOSC